MGASSTEKVRNVVFLGHGDAGKTSLAEAMLFMAGQTKRLGSVADGHSTLDYEAEEMKRKITLNLSMAPVEHKGVKINVIPADELNRWRKATDALDDQWAAAITAKGQDGKALLQAARDLVKKHTK